MRKFDLILIAVVFWSLSCDVRTERGRTPALRSMANFAQPVPSKWLNASKTLRRRGILPQQERETGTGEENGPPCSHERTRYPRGGTHSPITCGVAERLLRMQEQRALPHAKIFMKVGDSISASSEFMDCFETDVIDFSVNGNDALQGAWQWYLDGNLGTTTSYARRSHATRASQTASWVLDGDPSPLELEVRAIDPSVALVMFGTNDIYYGGHTASASLKFPWMYDQMKHLLGELIERGIVPILYSIPPYAGAHWQLATLVESYNTVLRGLAEGLQIPFVDYHARMKELPSMGLRDDGVHPNTKSGAACDFSLDGLRYGQNLRNLLTIQALNRVWQVTERSDERRYWDETGAPENIGRGTLMDPLQVDNGYFSRFDDLRIESENELAEIQCERASAATQSRGNEKVFQVSFSEPTAARVMLLRAKSNHMKLYWLHAPRADACLKSDSVMFRGIFPAGSHYFVVDAATPADEDEFLFLSAPCDPDDVRCQQAP